MKNLKWQIVLVLMFWVSNGVTEVHGDWREKLDEVEESGDVIAVLDLLEDLEASQVDSTGEVEAKLEVYSELVDELFFDVAEQKTETNDSLLEIKFEPEENSFEHSVSILSSYDYDDSKYSSRLFGLELGYSLGYSFDALGAYHMLGASVLGETLRGKTLSSGSQAADSRQLSTSFSLSYTFLSENWITMSLLDYSNWEDKADTDTTQVKAVLLYQSISQDFLKGEKWKGNWNIFGSYSPDFDDEVGGGLSSQYNSKGLRWKFGTQVKRSFSDRVTYEVFETTGQSGADTINMISNVEEWVTINPYISWKYKMGKKHVFRAKLSGDLEELVGKEKYLKYISDEVVWGGSIIKGDSAYYPYGSADGTEAEAYEIDGNEYQKSVRIIDWYLRLGYDYLFGAEGDLGNLEFRFKYEGQRPVFESMSNSKEDQTRFYGSIGYSIEF